mmetsp:Transcript_20092/g.65225  ORF Transcript_20092/g.65225 Transcript_20092/m.65225 type:complete len:283 (+) Transcript_20092:86-934(+)
MAICLWPLALGFASNIVGRRIRVAMRRDFLPFSGRAENGKPTGLLVELLLASMPGLDVEVEFVTPHELLVSDADAVLHSHRTPKQADKFYSYDVLALKNAAYTKAGSGIVLDHVFADLVGSNLSVATWQGATLHFGCAYEVYYGPEGAGAHLHIETLDAQERYMNFLRGEADVLLMDESLFDALSTLIDPGLMQKWPIGPIMSDGELEVGNRLRFQFAQAELGAYFDASFRNVCAGGKEDALYKAIVAKYGFPESRQYAWFNKFCVPALGLLGGAVEPQCPA